MGYTHYWREASPTNDTWEAFRADAQKLVEAAADKGITLCLEYDETDKPPTITANQIRFNGPGNLGYETFLMVKGVSEFQFCKTASRPYDLVVCAVLAVAKDHFPIDVSSDGDPDDWRPALEWASEVLGRQIAYPCQ